MIAKLTENLFISGENESDNISNLKELGITAILNVGYEVPSRNYKDFLMIKIGIYEFQDNPKYFIDLAIDVLENLIKNDNKVLVHCHAGAHRTPFIAFSYLARNQNKSLNEIYQEMMPRISWGVVFPSQIKVV